MRLIFFVVLGIVLIPDFSFCKSKKPVDTAAGGEQAVQYLLTSDVIVSPIVKPVYRMGDAAAVTLTKILDEQELSAEQIDRVLGIIHMSFERPAIVQAVSDREPKTTLFVLRSLERAASDEHLKARIKEERNFVLSQSVNAPKQ